MPFHFNLYLKIHDIEWFRHLEMHIKEHDYHKVLAGEGWAESASHVSAPTLSNCAVPSKTHAHTHEAGLRLC